MWQAVPESERRDTYDDVIFNLAKKEKEENKAMRKRNMKVTSREPLFGLKNSKNYLNFFEKCVKVTAKKA